MKNILTTIFLVLLFSNSSCKDHSKTLNEEPQKNVKTSDNYASLKIDEETVFKYQKWDLINKSDENYEIDGQKIQLKSFLNEAKNEGGKKIYFNGKEIDFIVSDAYVFTPYLFQNNNQKIILVREEDEGGIYGYIVYLLKDNQVVNKSYLDVSPTDQNLPINQFFEFKNHNDTVAAKILTDKYYDTKSDEVKSSSQYSFVLNKNQNDFDKKPIKPSVKQNFEAFNFSGQWKADCSIKNKVSNILFYDENGATLEMYDKSKLIAKLMLSFDRETKSLKYVGTNVIGENLNPQSIAGLTKGDVLGVVQITENNQITINWLGLYNGKTQTKVFAKNPFSEKKYFTLKKCRD